MGCPYAAPKATEASTPEATEAATAAPCRIRHRNRLAFSSPQPSLQASKNPHFMGISGVLPDHRHRWLLRARRERPRRRAAEQGDECAALYTHSITSSAE
jgi:hypothetical protein